jgi:hypothetical protein
LTVAEPALLRQGLQAAERCATRLERSVTRLQGLFPLDPVRLQSLAPQNQDDIDAFLKRFEQLVLSCRIRSSPGVAILEGESLHELSRRDVTELMERLGAIPSAKEFRNLVTIRNRLAHLYPEDPARQAGNLNGAFQASPALLAAARHIASFATRRTAGGR